jgi:hypothetical protein
MEQEMATEQFPVTNRYTGAQSARSSALVLLNSHCGKLHRALKITSDPCTRELANQYLGQLELAIEQAMTAPAAAQLILGEWGANGYGPGVDSVLADAEAHAALDARPKLHLFGRVER